MPNPSSDLDAPTVHASSVDVPTCTKANLPSRFGDYELLEEVARGGMGVVYRARQMDLNRIVAVKMIVNGRLACSEDIKRFKAEAEAAANLDHAGIVPIYEVGELGGQHFFSMAYVAGQSLANVLNSGPLDHMVAAQMLSEVAQAIHYAHQQGVIHRDLKPGNVLLDAERRPRVTDFGVAKRQLADQGLTIQGELLGTPSFMPPEQARGDNDQISPASDVYSLGAILYASLTGRPPFQSANQLDTLNQVIEDAVIPPRDLNSQVPMDLETITLKCLEKDQSRRYASAHAFAEDLDLFIEGKPITARPPGIMRRAATWFRSNLLVASMSGITTIGMAVGLFGLAWQYRFAYSTCSQLETKVSQLQDNAEVDRHHRSVLSFQRMTFENLFVKANSERLAMIANYYKSSDPQLALLLAAEACAPIVEDEDANESLAKKVLQRLLRLHGQEDLERLTFSGLIDKARDLAGRQLTEEEDLKFLLRRTDLIPSEHEDIEQQDTTDEDREKASDSQQHAGKPDLSNHHFTTGNDT